LDEPGDRAGDCAALRHLTSTIPLPRSCVPTNTQPMNSQSAPPHPTHQTTPIVAGSGNNGANTLRRADLLVHQHVMDKCALPKRLDRCRVQEHFTTNPLTLHQSQDQLQGVFTLREVGDGNAPEEKDSSSWLSRREDLPGLQGVWLALPCAKAVGSAQNEARWVSLARA